MKDISEEYLGKLISCLVNILVIQLEHGSSLSQPYFNTLTPWMILHCTLSQFEKKQTKKSIQDETPKETIKILSEPNDSTNKDKCVSPMPSTLLLITAHEELGK